MKISDLISKLQEQQRKYGDVKICTWLGDVTRVQIAPGRDGIASHINVNEIVIELEAG